MMEGLQKGQIGIDKMQLSIAHLFPHFNAQEKADVKEETERKLFLILKKYGRCKDDDV